MSIARPPLKKPKEASLTKLTKLLDTVFSRFIRLSYSKDGLLACYTCNHIGEIKKMHAGHYISRYYKSSRWDERNVRPQCFVCNIFKKGNSVIFRHKLIQEYGEEVIKTMEASVHTLSRGWQNRDVLMEQIAYYKRNIASME